MTEVLVNNFEYILKVRERVIFSLCAIAICFIVIYGFFMEKTISNTALMTAQQSTLDRENETLSNLSSQYVALSKNVTFDSALAQGFVEAPVSAFITVPARVPSNPALSINVSESGL